MFPAHAGMDRIMDVFPAPPWPCSPHTRGWTDGGHVFLLLNAHVPRTRGDGPSALGAVRSLLAMFPAHAGMDRLPGSVVLVLMFPAQAGMDRHTANLHQAAGRCSPHTWGWTVRGGSERRSGPHVPPHTRGWTGRTAGQLNFCNCVPRTRGDGPPRPGTILAMESLFPAHAGMGRNWKSPCGLHHLPANQHR